jgi:hypothetical protein
MIQKRAMGSFNCSFMNIDVRVEALGMIFLVIEWRFSVLVVFIFYGRANHLVLSGAARISSF